MAPPANSRKAKKAKAPPRRAAAKRSATGSRVSGIKKADGDAPVRAYIAKVRPEHRVIVERLDAIIERNVPGVRRAVKWSTPLWGIEGKGWFASFGSFKNYTKVMFFKGASLKPQPPEGEGKDMRAVNIASIDDLDEAQMAAWVKQAAAIPGWGK
jgi:hypothetical protein